VCARGVNTILFYQISSAFDILFADTKKKPEAGFALPVENFFGEKRGVVGR
jgi:hypothetical protein